MAIAVFLVRDGAIENIASVESESKAAEMYPGFSIVVRDESNEALQIGDKIL
jgi:hypothetical protein